MEFTFDEWSEWCRKHDSGETVFSHGEFGFNISDVCLTPKTAVRWSGGGRFSFKVNVAQSPCGRWSSGVECRFGFGYSSSPAVFVSDLDEGFATVREAVCDGLERIERALSSEETDVAWHRGYEDEEAPEFRPRGELKAARRELERLKDIYDPVQLELF